MKKSEFDKYIENYIENLEKVNDKRKARFFIEYLKTYLGEKHLDTAVVFGLLDKEFLLGSLNAYLTQKSPSKSAARDYKRTVLELFQEVCKVYGIENNFLKSAPEQDDFDATAKEWIDLLREPKSREIMSFDDFETLDEAIKDFLIQKT